MNMPIIHGSKIVVHASYFAKLSNGDPVYQHDELFTHIDDDGTVRHFAVGALQRRIQQHNYPVTKVAIDPEFAEFIRDDRGIELPRLTMTDAQRDKPIIGRNMSKGTVLIIDGHHRYLRRHMDGFPFIDMHILPEKLWPLYLMDLPKDKAFALACVGKDA